MQASLWKKNYKRRTSTLNSLYTTLSQLKATLIKVLSNRSRGPSHSLASIKILDSPGYFLWSESLYRASPLLLYLMLCSTSDLLSVLYSICSAYYTHSMLCQTPLDGCMSLPHTDAFAHSSLSHVATAWDPSRLHSLVLFHHKTL